MTNVNDKILELAGPLTDSAMVLKVLLAQERSERDFEERKNAQKDTDEAINIQIAAVQKIVNLIESGEADD